MASFSGFLASKGVNFVPGFRYFCPWFANIFLQHFFHRGTLLLPTLTLEILAGPNNAESLGPQFEPYCLHHPALANRVDCLGSRIARFCGQFRRSHSGLSGLCVHSGSLWLILAYRLCIRKRRSWRQGFRAADDCMGSRYQDWEAGNAGPIQLSDPPATEFNRFELERPFCRGVSGLGQFQRKECYKDL
jgi:hypothetical protein